MPKFKVTFYPEEISVEVPEDTSILRAAHEAGIKLDARCGGQGTCAACKVIVRNGNVHFPDSGKLSPAEKDKGVCLACLGRVRGDLEVEIPFSSRLEIEKLSVDDNSSRLPSEALSDFAFSPLAERLSLELPVPDINDKISDWERVCRQLRAEHGVSEALEIPLSELRRLPELLRSAGWRITLFLARGRGCRKVIRLEAGGGHAGANYGVCFDIGTTTIAGQLVDLKNGEPLSGRTVYNAQAAFGSDVISRIVHSSKPQGLEELRQAALQGVNRIIDDLALEKGIDKGGINCVSFAGNTIMAHLLLGIDPRNIRKEPYLPVVNELPYLNAADAGLPIAQAAPVFFLPSVAGYAGGDLIAGVLACGMHKADEVCLLIDIGTNGEIALGNKDFLICAAASAGPAFEGSGVTCGMRATAGAIHKVSALNGGCAILGDSPARGICGSGYIDLLAAMLREGVMDKNGKLRDEADGVRPGLHSKEFLVAGGIAGEDILISEADIENLKRAKAAIYAAASSLLRHMGMGFNQLARIYISGGFGNYINIDSAIEIGLLPLLEQGRFCFCGNTSLAGARSALLSAQARQEAVDIASRMTYCELSLEPAYMEEYMAALFFPHTDVEGFGIGR